MRIKLTAVFLAGAVVTALPVQAQINKGFQNFNYVANPTQPAQTQTTNTVTTSVNARAGLASLFEVTCSPVNFGVWHVPVRNTGGVTHIGLTVSANDSTGITTPRATFNTNLVSLASSYNLPEAGTCIVTGAITVSTNLPIGISNHNDLSFIASNHEGLGTPGTLASLKAYLALANDSVLVDANGSGSFRVIGILEIPEEIKAENYGGYETDISATVSVTDMTQTVTPQNSPF